MSQNKKYEEDFFNFDDDFSLEDLDGVHSSKTSQQYLDDLNDLDDYCEGDWANWNIPHYSSDEGYKNESAEKNEKVSEKKEDKYECTCGAWKVYGVQCSLNFHAYWCDIHKRR